LLMASLSYAIAIGFAAGGADPPLVLFETLALWALVFLDDARSRDVLAAIGLAGAAMTKVEGATFVIAVVLALLIVRREVKRTLLIAAPAIVILLPWLAPLVLLFLGKRRAVLPLLVVALTLCATVFFYIHLEEPSWWIAASAP